MKALQSQPDRSEDLTVEDYEAFARGLRFAIVLSSVIWILAYIAWRALR